MDLDICPKFLKFKAPNISSYRSLSHIFNYGLKNKVKETKSYLKNAKNKYKLVKNSIFCKISFVEKYCLIALLQKSYKKLAQTVSPIHQRKLFNLWREQRQRSPNCIVNLSSMRLSIQEEDVLRFGLDHHILPRKIDKDFLKTQLEPLFYQIKRKSNIDFFNDEIKDQVKFIFQKFIITATLSAQQNEISSFIELFALFLTILT